MGELVTREGKAIRKGRISPALRTAIVLIVEEGLTVAEAAQRTGYKCESLAKALIKPHVKAARAAVKRAWLNSETEQAWLTVAKLARSSPSDDVRLKAAKVLLDAHGELDGSANAARKGPGSMVQINLVQAPPAEHSTPHRLPGVVEYQAPQRVRSDPSNLKPVGRGSTAADGA